MALAVVLAAGYGVAVNLWAFSLFGIDKRRAVAGEWRIREATLIGVALAGGWLGAKAGQRRFRHKTRKQPFAKRLNAAGLLHLGLLMVLAAVTLSAPVEVAAGVGWVAETFEHIMSAPANEAWQADAAPQTRRMPTRFGPGSGDGM